MERTSSLSERKEWKSQFLIILNWRGRTETSLEFLLLTRLIKTCCEKYKLHVSYHKRKKDIGFRTLLWNYTNATINTKRNTILSKQRNPFEFYETNPSCRVQGKTVVTARGQAYLEPGREMASRAATPIPTDFFSQTDQQVWKDGALSSQNHFKTYNTIYHDCTWDFHHRYFWPLYCVQLSQSLCIGSTTPR